MDDKHVASRIRAFMRDKIITNHLFFRLFDLIDSYIEKNDSPYYLKILKGNLINMADEVSLEDYPLSLAKQYYQEAIAINKDLPEAYIELAWYFDVFEDNFIEADRNFRKALSINNDPEIAKMHEELLFQYGHKKDVPQK